MNRDEIENRIIVCETRANGYREAGNTKTADRYEDEKRKWEKLLCDLNLLNERKIDELREYKKGYFALQEQNTKYKAVIGKAINKLGKYADEMTSNGNAYAICVDLLDTLKGD